MSTLSLRKIKHDNSAVDNLTLDSSGNVGINKTTPRATGGFNSLSLNGTDGSEIWFDAGNTATTRLSGTASETRITAQASGSVITMFTGATERLRVDNSGRVTMPYQPAFQTDEYGPGSISANTQYVFKATALHNIGNYYNSTNGRFTAPVSGMYHFSFVVTPSSAISSPAVWIRKNGSGSPRYGLCLAYSSSYNAASCSPNIYLNANEYVEPIIEEWNGGTSLAIWSAQFGGFLIG